MAICRADKWTGNVYTYDKSGYHLYLPAVFIYNDLERLSFYPHLEKTYRIADVPWFSIIDAPNGKKLNKYTVGTCLFEMPFFLLAHSYNLVGRAHPPDGYSIPYQWGTTLAVMFWVILGLIILGDFLRRYFSDTITLITIICLSIGTNLYYYLVYDPGGNHTHSFFLVAALLNVTDIWYKKQKSRHLYLMSLLMGLITITRPVDVFIAIIPIFWSVNSIHSFKERMQLFWHHKARVLVSLFFFALILLIQLSYWKLITGNWITYTYGKEHFLWTDSRVIDGLFSYRKGWFVYTPMAFISMLGFISLSRSHKDLIPSFLVFYAVIIYVTYAWWCWWYGGGFGCRPMVDFLPLLALPLAALFRDAFSYRLPVKFLCSILLVGLIALNLFQTYQYTLWLLPDGKITGDYYWHVFGKTHVEEKDYELLLDDRTYWKDMGRIDRE